MVLEAQATLRLQAQKNLENRYLETLTISIIRNNYATQFILGKGPNLAPKWWPMQKPN